MSGALKRHGLDWPNLGQAKRKYLLRDLWSRNGERNERVYLAWHALRENAMDAGIGEKKARGAATREMAKRFKLSEREIQNIVSKGDRHEDVLQARALVTRDKNDAQVRAFRRMHLAIMTAVPILEQSGYQDILAECAMRSLTSPRKSWREPKAMQAFSSDDKATGAESLQRLAAVLATAFIRAHKARVEAEQRAEKAEKEVKRLNIRNAADAVAPGYGRLRSSPK